MTYKEIKDRLTKCEFTLNSIKNGTFKSTTKGSLKDQESLLSGEIGDIKSILSSSKSPYPAQNTAR